MRKSIVLGITSGIAAYKALDLITLLQLQSIDVHVVMTTHATHIISPKEIEKITKNKVYYELFKKDFDYTEILQARRVDHIALADTADLMIIAPATANIIAKLAHGIADDFLTTTVLAMTKPIIVCPAMNSNMWNNATVQENIARLKTLGYIVIGPEVGMLACGYEGMGRLADTQTIGKEIHQHLRKSTVLKGKKVLVTAGATIEKIDDVRYITNPSTGKMGTAIAEACYTQGAEVLLLKSKQSVETKYPIKQEIFSSSEELLQLIENYARQYDYIYHTAAVGDFSVENKKAGKISSQSNLILTLTPQKKIVNQIKKINPAIKLVAFKAEYTSDQDTLIEKAKQKLQEAHAEAIVANDISRSDRGFASDMNEVLVITKNNVTKIPHATKKDIATKIVDSISKNDF